MGAIATKVVLTIDGGDAPYTCEGAGILQPRAPSEPECVFIGTSPGVHAYTVRDGNGDEKAVEVKVEDVFELSVTPK